MATTARELAIIISASNQSGPALLALQAQLRGVQAATVGMGATSVTAAGQMGVIYGAQGQILSRLGPTAAAMNTATVSTAKMAVQTAGLQKVMTGAAGAISPITLGLAGMGVASVLAVKGVVDAGTSWESAFAGVRKTVDATDAELAGFARGIRSMATEIPASREEIARVAEAAGQLGIQNDSLMSFTRTMVDMGVATNMSSDEAATALARLANITGMPQSQFDRLGSTVVDLGNKFAGTEAEIVEMGLRIAGAGSQIGMSEAQIMAWATALSSVGVNAEAGGSAISRTFIDMAAAVADGGKELRLFADVAGMDVAKFSTLFRTDASGAVQAFIAGLGRIKTEGGNVFGTLEQLGMSEIRQRDALLRLSGASDIVARATIVANQAWQENTALTAEAERRYGTTASKIEVMKSKFSELQVSGFELIQPGLNATIEGFGNLAGHLANGAANMAEIQANTGGVSAAFQEAIPFLGDLTIAWGNLDRVARDYANVLAWIRGVDLSGLGLPGGEEDRLRAMFAPMDGALRNRRAEDASKLPWVSAEAGKLGGKMLLGDELGSLQQAIDAQDEMAASTHNTEMAQKGLEAQLDRSIMAEMLDREIVDESNTILDMHNKNLKERETREKAAAAAAKASAKETKDAMAELQKAFTDLASTPVAGATAFSLAEVNLQDQIAQSRFAIDAMKRGVLPRAGLGAEAKRLADLERQQETLRLARDATVGSAERRQRLLGSTAGAEMGTADLFGRMEVARGNLGLPGMGGVTNNVSVQIDAGGNVAVSADTAWGRQFGGALADFMDDLLAGGGALPARNQGGANPQLAGAG